MSELLKTNVDKYLKNRKTNAVVNTDLGQYHSAVAQRNKSKQIAAMMRDIDYLKEAVKRLESKNV